MLTARSLRTWAFVHKWTSLICTTVGLLLCLTGLPLIFRDEIALWLGNAVEPPEMAADIPLITVDRIVEAARARRPDEFIRAVARDEDGPAWDVFLGVAPNAKENSAIFTFDARTGELLHERRLRQGIMYVILKLHVELFAGLPGTLLLGFVGLLFLASVVSGIVLYGPFMRKLPFGTVRRERDWRLRWLDLHNLLGIVTVLWVLVVGTTGVINTLAKPIFSYWQATQLAELIAPWRGKPPPTGVIGLQKAIDAAQAAVPQMELRSVGFPGSPNAGAHHYVVFMKGKTALTARLLIPVLIDAETGSLTDKRDMPWYVTAFRVSQPLHFGDYGGMPLKIVWALLDIMTIIVMVSGLYLWWTKRKVSFEQLLAEADPDSRMVGSGTWLEPR